MLIIPQNILDDISEHSKEAYPEECCGLLVGRDSGRDRVIVEAHRAKNVAEERRHERYLIDPKKHFEVDKATRGRGVDIVGFYHSHPDYPSRPSGFDTETAPWPGYSYLIASVEKDGVGKVQSWIMLDGEDKFVEEEMKIGETAES